MTKRNKIGLFLLILIGLSLRMTWVVSVPNIQLSDFADYDRLAKALIKTGAYSDINGDSTAFRPPGMAFFLAMIYSISGINEFYGKISQVILSTILCLLIFFLGKRAVNTQVAFIAVSIAVFFPDFIYSTSILNSELAFTCLTATGVLLLSIDLDSLENIRPLSLISSGILFGIAALFRPVALTAPVAFLFMLLWSRARAPEIIRSTILFSIAMIIPLAPWTFRNYNIFKIPVLISTNGGYNLLCGNNPNGTVVWVSETTLLKLDNMPPSTTWKKLNEVEKNSALQERALTYIKEYPSGFFRRLPRKFYLLLLSPEVPWLYWNMEGLGKDNKIEGTTLTLLASISRLFWYLLLSLSIMTIPLAHRFKRNGAIPISAALMILWTTIQMVYWGKARFRFPLYPFLIVMAAASCYYLTRKSAEHISKFQNRDQQ
jgi:4-amino-4-deoxy-L-arabinose transferase-like glycosyltransferase